VSGSVLFDAPGPRARMRHRLYSLLFLLAVAALLYWIYLKFDEAGQFEPELWERLTSDGVWEEILSGLRYTLQAAGIAIVTSVFFGFLVATARLSDHRWISMPATAIVEFFRAIPLLLLLIFLFVFIQQQADFERQTNALVALVTGLTLYNGAVLAEVFRAGIQAVPRGQSEAAYAIGMRKTQVMTIVLSPQAVKYMLPAIISQCVVVLKDTSLGAVAFAYGPELVRAGRLISQFVGSSLMTYLVIAAMFIAMNSILSALAYWLERRLATRGRAEEKAVEQVEGVLEAG
jgi:glutamate transport system permease protein